MAGRSELGVIEAQPGEEVDLRPLLADLLDAAAQHVRNTSAWR
ncbi:hypothetical protein ACWC5I_25715 [Kitasatospora sp. NPDC001574]